LSNRTDATPLDDAMTAYRVRLKVPHLKGGRPKMVEFHTPVGVRRDLFVCTGAFARVYQWTDTNGKERAVRCFYTIPPAEVQDHYKAIDQFFRDHLAVNTAELAYHERALTIKRPPDPDLLMPIIEMEWVDGETLVAHVDRLAMQKDKAGLRQLRQGWLDLLSRMWELQMAHGDLSGENVMVRRDGSLVLVDYDSVYIPAFRGLSSNQAGNPAYQHREMMQREFNARMDDFSALLIYVALFALGEQPGLWPRYALHDLAGKLQTDTILFQPDGIKALAQSQLFQDLERIGNPDFQKVLQVLRRAAEGPLGSVPEFALLINPVLGRQAAETRLRAAIQCKDTDAIVAAANDLVLATSPISDPALVTAVAAARKQIQQVVELDEHLAGGRDAAALATWKRDNFHQTPKGSTYAARLGPIEQRLEGIGKLEAALTNQNDVEAVRLWDQQTAIYERHAPQLKAQVQQACVRLLQKAITANEEQTIVQAADTHAARLTPSDLAPHAPRIQLARDRLTQRDRLEGLLQTENDQATLNGWLVNGFDTCSLASLFAARVALVRRRWESWQKVEQIMGDSGVPGQQQRLFDAWDEALFKDYRRADAHRSAYEQVKIQLGQIQPLRDALKKPVDDATVVAAWERVKNLPSAASYRKAVEQSQTRLNQVRRAALDQLTRAVNSRDETQIKVAWDNPLLLRTLPEVQGLKPQVEEALARVEAAAWITQYAGTPEYDEEVLHRWSRHRLEASKLGAPLKERIAAVEQRRKVFDQVVAALRRNDDAQLFTIWDERLLRDYPALQRHQPEIEEARQRLRSAAALKTALQANNDKLVMVIWDTLRGRELPDTTALEPKVRARKLRWLGARAPHHLEGTLDGTGLTLTWTWPEGLQIAGVTVRRDRYATHFAPNIPDQSVWWCRRADYERDRRFVAHLTSLHDQAYVRIFALVQHGQEWLTAPYQAPVQLLLQSIRTVTYRLQREANKTTYLEVDAANLATLPQLRIMVGATPPQPGGTGASGTQVGVVRPDHQMPNSSIYRVPLMMSNWRHQVYLTLVPLNLQDQRWLRIVPAGGGDALPVPPAP